MLEREKKKKVVVWGGGGIRRPAVRHCSGFHSWLRIMLKIIHLLTFYVSPLHPEEPGEEGAACVTEALILIKIVEKRN